MALTLFTYKPVVGPTANSTGFKLRFQVIIYISCMTLNASVNNDLSVFRKHLVELWNTIMNNDD